MGMSATMWLSATMGLAAAGKAAAAICAETGSRISISESKSGVEFSEIKMCILNL